MGETKRNLKTRITNAIQTGDQKNGIAVHVQKDHRIHCESAKVKEVVPKYGKRTVEALRSRVPPTQ